MKRLLLFFLAFAPDISYGQSTELFEKLKAVYPEDNGVYIQRDKSITLSVKDDSLVSSASVYESVLFLKDQATQASGWRVYGSYFQQIENLEAKSLLLENGKYKPLKMKPTSKKQEDDQSVFFDDSYFYPMSFPAGKAGDQAIWSFEEKYKDPRFLPAFYFSSYLPQVKSKLTIKATKGIDIAWSVYNDAEKKIQFNQYDKGGFTYYEWQAENIKAPQHEAESPKFYYYVPQVVYYVKSFPTKKGRTKVLSSADDLYHDYLHTISNLTEPPSPELESVVHSLIKPGDQEVDIVKKVFYWVQDQVRYIAFEDGMRGLIPHKPNYILEKRYGDCKDMASIMVGMLRVAGIKAYYTWIGTRDLPYRYSTLPTPLVDNHMIATYIDSHKNYYFLDATGNYTRMDFPSSMIQGKEAMIVFGDSGYEIHEVPEMAWSQNKKQDSVWVSIENKSLTGKGKVYFTGYQKINASYSLDKAVEERKKDNVVSWVGKGNNKFYLESFSIHSLNEKDAPLSLDYNFKLNDYLNEVGNEFYLNLNLDKLYYNYYMPVERKVPREFDFKGGYEETYILSVPEGYEVEYLPANAEYNSSTLGFTITYSRNGKQIILSSRVYTNVLLLNPDQFSEWNDGIKKLSKAYKESIILKKTKQ